MNQELGINISTLLYVIIDRDRLCSSTWNPTLCSVTTHMRKEPKKGLIHTYVQLSHFAVHLKLMQHCKSNILQ